MSIACWLLNVGDLIIIPTFVEEGIILLFFFGGGAGASAGFVGLTSAAKLKTNLSIQETK